MSADEFLVWAESQPGKFELADGQVVAMAPERVSHGQTKGEIYARLREALRAGHLPCQAFVDSVGIRVDESTIYQPDVLVRCGPPLPGDLSVVPDPLVVIEVLSPSTQALDVGIKLAGYLKLDSIRHYIVADGDKHLLIHHERRADGVIITHIVRDGALTLDPPGITVRDLFDF